MSTPKRIKVPVIPPLPKAPKPTHRCCVCSWKGKPLNIDGRPACASLGCEASAFPLKAEAKRTAAGSGYGYLINTTGRSLAAVAKMCGLGDQWHEPDEMSVALSTGSFDNAMGDNPANGEKCLLLCQDDQLNEDGPKTQVGMFNLASVMALAAGAPMMSDAVDKLAAKAAELAERVVELEALLQGIGPYDADDDEYHARVHRHQRFEHAKAIDEYANGKRPGGSKGGLKRLAERIRSGKLAE